MRLLTALLKAFTFTLVISCILGILFSVFILATTLFGGWGIGFSLFLILIAILTIIFYVD